MTHDRNSRREFLKGAGAGLAVGAGLALPARGQAPAAKVRYGVIGTGSRGQGHLRAINEILDIEVVAVCDINDRRLQQGSALVRTRPATYTDYRKLIERKDVDAVILVVPDYLHAEMAVAAFKAGKHVLAEKPMATTLADADAMIAAAQRSGKVLQIGLQLRYTGLYVTAAKEIQQGRVGQLKYISANLYRGDWANWEKLPPEDREDRKWYTWKRYTGGTFVDLVGHDFDIFHLVTGSEPRTIYAIGGLSQYRDGRDTVDHAHAAIKYASGVRLGFALNMFAPENRGREMWLIGDHGTLYCSTGEQAIFFRDRASRKETRIEISKQDGTLEQHKAFIESIRTGKPPYPDAKMGRAALKTSLATERSIAEGRAIGWTEL